MREAAAWMLIVLGMLHVVFGLLRFRVPIREAIREGFVGRFMQSDTRRLAFWFILVGPLLALLGQLALDAVHRDDESAMLTIGLSLLGTSLVGVLAFPRSPLWAVLVPAAILVSAGLGWIA